MNDIIYAYTRKEAIDDGFLVDVSKLAGKAGFKYPVAMSRTVFEQCVAVPEGATDQDEVGRLWDILTMLRFAIKTSRDQNVADIRFKLSVVGPNGHRSLVHLKALCGPGDDAEPVITIMLPQED